MKNRNLFYNISILILSLAIIIVVLFKFVLNHNVEKAFDIKNYDQIHLVDFSGKQVNFSDILCKHKSLYFLIFGLNSCYSCVSKGLMDLKDLSKSGNFCIAIAVHDNINELKGWARHEDFSPFYMLSKENFYKSIKSQYLSVIVKIDDKVIKNYRFITP
jgi:hypothetical protein